jgi:hypothetical protein
MLSPDSSIQSLDDSCVASCMDWYGNARPIFLPNRTLALMDTAGFPTITTLYTPTPFIILAPGILCEKGAR